MVRNVGDRRTERAWPRAGACGRSAEAVAAGPRRGPFVALRRLPCGARSGGPPQNSLRSLRSLRFNSRGESVVDARCARDIQPSAPRRFPCPPAPTRPRPCVRALSLLDERTAGGFKAGADGCTGAWAAMSIAAQRGKSVVPDGLARRLHATARSATVRRHRSPPAEREAQGTRSAAKGAAAAAGRPSAPALPRRRSREQVP